MILKEKIQTIIIDDYGNLQKILLLEKIAEDFAIEFTEWICKNHETDAIVFGILDTKQLLKTFKEMETI